MVRSHLTPLVIVGPTASGKSALAMDLAQRHDGEIICADSRQFYAHMSIGTACPSIKEQTLVPHHGYQTVDPAHQKIDAGFFIDFAKEKIEQIQARRKRPILVGGTGLYLRSLYYGITDVPPSSKDVVLMLNRRCDETGLHELYQELLSIDKKSADAIKPNDRYRIIRALEIFHITGERPSVLRKSFVHGKPQIRAHWIYKRPDKKALLSTIKKRVNGMMERGLVEEAKRLREILPEGHWALDVMGYKEALMITDLKLTLSQAEENIACRHRQYAKRQYTWFDKEPFYQFRIS